MNLISTISLVLSGVAIAVSLIANHRSVRAAQAAATLALVKDVLIRRQHADFSAALREMRNGDFAAGMDGRDGFVGMPDPRRTQAYLVADFFDDLGKIIAHKVINEDIIIGAYGATALWTWEVLQPYVQGQRVINQSNFNIYYEFLVRRATVRPPSTIHRKLGLLGD